MLKILGRLTSINVRKVLWVADELGMAYEREDWGLPQRDPRVPEFLALNPNGQVPVIIDDGYVLWESHVIMRYLAEKDGRDGLLPTLPRHRALVEQWLQWQASELNPAWGYAVYALLRKAPGYDDQARIADSIEKWTGKMRILESHLQTSGSFVANERYSLADIALALSIHRWLLTPFEKPALPQVDAYFARLKARPLALPYLGPNTP